VTQRAHRWRSRDPRASARGRDAACVRSPFARSPRSLSSERAARIAHRRVRKAKRCHSAPPGIAFSATMPGGPTSAATLPHRGSAAPR
jgi:hypothetical protein